MNRYIYLALAVFFVSCAQQHLAIAEGVMIGPSDPRFAKELRWFEDDWRKDSEQKGNIWLGDNGVAKHPNDQKFIQSPTRGWLVNELGHQIMPNRLRPYIENAGELVVKSLTFNDILLLDRDTRTERDTVTAFYVAEIEGFDRHASSKDIRIVAQFRTSRDNSRDAAFKLHTELLYIADRPISVTLYYNVLPEFLRSISYGHNMAFRENPLKNRNIHIEHISGANGNIKSKQLWTLFGSGREIGQSFVTIYTDKNGEEHYRVERNKRFLER